MHNRAAVVPVSTKVYLIKTANYIAAYGAIGFNYTQTKTVMVEGNGVKQ